MTYEKGPSTRRRPKSLPPRSGFKRLVLENYSRSKYNGDGSLYRPELTPSQRQALRAKEHNS